MTDGQTDGLSRNYSVTFVEYAVKRRRKLLDERLQMHANEQL